MVRGQEKEMLFWADPGHAGAQHTICGEVKRAACLAPKPGFDLVLTSPH